MSNQKPTCYSKNINATEAFMITIIASVII